MKQAPLPVGQHCRGKFVEDKNITYLHCVILRVDKMEKEEGISYSYQAYSLVTKDLVYIFHEDVFQLLHVEDVKTTTHQKGKMYKLGTDIKIEREGETNILGSPKYKKGEIDGLVYTISMIDLDELKKLGKNIQLDKQKRYTSPLSQVMLEERDFILND